MDITDIDRFATIRNKDSFLKKVFTDREREYIIVKKKGALQTIAGMFAAKEAFFKSVSGLEKRVGWKDVEILHDERGCPFLVCAKGLFKGVNFSLSISHDGHYAVAVVVAEKAIIYKNK